MVAEAVASNPHDFDAQLSSLRNNEGGQMLDDYRTIVAGRLSFTQLSWYIFSWLTGDK